MALLVIGDVVSNSAREWASKATTRAPVPLCAGTQKLFNGDTKIETNTWRGRLSPEKFLLRLYKSNAASYSPDIGYAMSSGVFVMNYSTATS